MSERKVDVFCTYCGTRIPENTLDCPNCGKPQTKPPIKERRYRSELFGRTVPRRGLLEKDIMIIMFLIFGLTVSVAIIIVLLVVTIPK